MNADYGDLNSRTAGIMLPAGLPPQNGLFGVGPAGLELSQLFISPTLAFKLGANHSFGIAPVFAYQRFAAEGLHNFDNPIASASPGDVTNKGQDGSVGLGFHLGWIGEILPHLTIGATYRSRINVGNLDKYKGLLAEQGGLDIPATYGAGVAFRPTPAFTLAVDVQRIEYGDIAALSHIGNVAAQLGSNDGPGFGWRDETIVKAGVSYAYNEQLTLRAGYSHGWQPVPNSQSLLNILAPVTIEDHLTVGATWTLPNQSQLSFAYTHGFSKTLHGAGPSAGTNISLDGDILGLAYSWKL